MALNVDPSKVLLETFMFGSPIEIEELASKIFSRVTSTEIICITSCIGLLKDLELVKQNKRITVTMYGQILVEKREKVGFTRIRIMQAMSNANRVWFDVKTIAFIVSPSNSSEQMQDLVHQDLMYLLGRCLVEREGEVYRLTSKSKKLFNNYYHLEEAKAVTCDYSETSIPVDDKEKHKDVGKGSTVGITSSQTGVTKTKLRKTSSLSDLDVDAAVSLMSITSSDSDENKADTAQNTEQENDMKEGDMQEEDKGGENRQVLVTYICSDCKKKKAGGKITYIK